MKKLFVMTLTFLIAGIVQAAQPEITMNIWPAKAPGETKELPPEADLTKDTDKLIVSWLPNHQSVQQA